MMPTTRRNFLSNAFGILPAATTYARSWKVAASGLVFPANEPLSLVWHRYQRDFADLHEKYARIMPLRYQIIDGRLFFLGPPGVF